MLYLLIFIGGMILGAFLMVGILGLCWSSYADDAAHGRQEWQQ